MRFQTTNQVPCEDAELVLAVLEDRLHTLAHEVVREGRRITLFGLGPSPRAMNPRDKTMIDVSAGDGVTTIDADVTFQASAFLGETPQDQIVLGKLERVFEEINAELGLNRRRDVLKPVSVPRKVIPIESAAVERAVAVESAPEVSGPPETAMEMAVAVEDVSSTVVELPPTARVDEVAVERARIAAAEPTSIPVVEPPIVVAEPTPVAAVETPMVVTESIPFSVVEPTIIEEEPTPGHVVERTVVVVEPTPIPVILPQVAIEAASRMPVVEPRIVFAEPTPIAAIERQVPAPVETKQRLEDWIREAAVLNHKEEPRRGRRIGWVAGGACVAVAAVITARYLAEMQGAALPAVQPAPVTQSSPVTQPATVAQLAPVAATVPAQKTVPAPVPAPPQAGAAEDPAEVVKQWELAMQSRDAASQAAFYADTVGRYFLRDNVGRDAVLADKQAEIDKRKGSWTMKMDRVKVDRKGDAASVSLVKHFTVQQEGEPASEWFVPTQLKLKREDGRWRIVSERALGWAHSLDDLDG